MGETKRKLFGHKSTLTIGTAVATGLAAITTSIIATRLAGVLNSIILAGVVSIISAVVGEIYRNLVAATTEKTKEVIVEPIVKLAKVDGETTVLQPVGAKTKTADGEHGPPGDDPAPPGDDPAPPGDDPAPPDGDPALLGDGHGTSADESATVESAVVEVTLKEGSSEGPDGKATFRQRLAAYFERNRYMQWILLFSGVIILTSLINLWLFPDSADQYYFNTTVQSGPAELSEAEKQEIIDSAANQAGQNNGETAPDEGATPAVDDLAGTGTDAETIALLSEIVVQLQQENADLTARLGEQEGANTALQARLDALEIQVAELAALIEQNANQQAEGG